MNTRQFDAQTAVSEIGLGTWQLGGDWGGVNDTTSERIVDTAIEHGITFFDTSDVYGNGLSEERISRLLKRYKEEIFVATKVGRFDPPGWPQNFTYDVMRQHTEASLRRLQTEALDLTQLHCIPTEELRRGEVFDHLRRLKQEGKIKRFGASVESMEEALICLEQEGLSSLQIIFNLFRQKPINTLFEQAKAKGVAIIVRLPLASGLLAGKFTLETTFSEDDHRNYNRDGDVFNVGETFAGLPFGVGVQLVDDLRRLVPQEMSMAQFAQRWILDFDAVTTVITGASKPKQVASNASVTNIMPLPKELHKSLSIFYHTQVHDSIRGPY